MASWKKVIVSGSAAELLNVTASAGLFSTSINVGSNQVINTSPASTQLSGSFSGSFFGNGSGLTGVSAAFPTTALTPILGTTQVFVNDGSNKYATVSQFSSASWAGITGDITINGSGVSAIGSGKVTNAMLVNSSIYVTAGGGLTGDGSVALGATASLAVGAGTGITVNANDVQLKNAGSLSNNTVTKWDSGNGQLVNSIITDNGTLVTVGGNFNATGYISTINSITGSAISASGALTGNTVTAATLITAGSNISTTGGNITAPSGYITAGSPGGAPNSVGAVQGQLGYFGTLTVPGDANISGNTTITGNLSVAGTASFNNSTSLLIADKFALFASGSTSLTDGGIIIQHTAGGIGTAFYLEASSTGTYGRFAVTGSLEAGASTATVDEFVVTVKQASGAPAAAPTFGSTGNGYGNMYINSSNSDIYIYA
jgi:hypothetical protein